MANNPSNTSAVAQNTAQDDVSDSSQELAQSNIKALKEGLKLLSMLEPAHYQQGFKPAFESHIGAHFRHLIEHYQCFFTQLPSGSISYDKRERDACLEVDIGYAKDTLVQICEQLGGTDFVGLSNHNLAKPLMVEDQHLSGLVATTIERELLFLLSHTVHHFALIAAMARAVGLNPADGFGVAIATQSFQTCENSAQATPNVS